MLEIFVMILGIVAILIMVSENRGKPHKLNNEDIVKEKNEIPVSTEGELGSIILELVNNGYDIEVWKNSIRFKFPDGRQTPNVGYDNESGYRNIVFLAYADYLEKKREKIAGIVIQDFEKLKVDAFTLIDKLP